MSINRKILNTSRRQILRGAGGFTLTLPFLPSLATKTAYGADPIIVSPPRFVCMTTEHGGIDASSMYPADSTLTTKTTMFTGHDVRQGKLTRSQSGDSAQLSTVIKGPANRLTDGLVGKMNVLRGFDVPHDCGHNTGNHLGNFARCDQPPGDTTLVPFPTIDQVMAWSPSFYKNKTPKLRSVVTGNDFRGISWGFANPAAKSGAVVKIDVQSDPTTLFNQLFIPGQAAAAPTTPAAPMAAPRKSVVDGVLEGYRSLRQSNTRLSSADKDRLDAHVAFLAELQAKLPSSSGGGGTGNSTATPKACGNAVAPPPNVHGVGNAAGFQALNDVILAGFLCDTSRVATVCVTQIFVSQGGDWHQDVAHMDYMPGPQKMLVDNLQITFENIFLDLIAKLDGAEESPGHTYLDNSLVMWSQESGQSTHDSHSNPIVTAGSAAGFFKTGNYCDYRNHSKVWDAGEHKTEFMGVTHRQWLANVLQSMNVPRSEFEANGAPGYGETYKQSNQSANEPEIDSKASDILPFIKA